MNKRWSLGGPLYSGALAGRGRGAPLVRVRARRANTAVQPGAAGEGVAAPPPAAPAGQCCDDLTTDSVPEGNCNKYFTPSRVIRSVERGELSRLSAQTIHSRDLTVRGTLTVEGSMSLGGLTVDGPVTAEAFIAKSDRRLKRDIESISQERGREVVSGLRACTYAYNREPDRPRAGFIAQEVRKTAPHLVTSQSDGMLGVDMLGVIPYLVAEVKGLRAELEEARGRFSLGTHRDC